MQSTVPIDSMLRSAVSLIALALASCAATESSGSQRPVRVISGQPACRECRVERYLVATLNDSLFPLGALHELARVHATNDGRYLVMAGSLTPDRIFLANQSGAIVQQIGKEGEGPGEFKKPSAVGELPSAYLVFDQRLRRATRLSQRDLRVEAEAPMPGWSVYPFAIFPDGRYAMSGLLRTPAEAGYPVHMVAPDGRVLRSFGGWRAVAPRMPGQLFNRAVAVSREGTLWIGRTEQYRLEKWDTTGNLLAVYDRRVSWFPPMDSIAWISGQRKQMGQPTLTDLWEDEEGLLWVQILVRLAVPDVPLGHPGEQPGLDTIIEVLDPDRGRVVATTRFRNWLPFVVTGGFFQSSYRTTGSGQPLIDIWAFRIRS